MGTHHHRRRPHAMHTFINQSPLSGARGTLPHERAASAQLLGRRPPGGRPTRPNAIQCRPTTASDPPRRHRPGRARAPAAACTTRRPTVRGADRRPSPGATRRGSAVRTPARWRRGDRRVRARAACAPSPPAQPTCFQPARPTFAHPTSSTSARTHTPALEPQPTLAITSPPCNSLVDLPDKALHRPLPVFVAARHLVVQPDSSSPGLTSLGDATSGQCDRSCGSGIHHHQQAGPDPTHQALNLMDHPPWRVAGRCAENRFLKRPTPVKVVADMRTRPISPRNEMHEETRPWSSVLPGARARAPAPAAAAGRAPGRPWQRATTMAEHDDARRLTKRTPGQGPREHHRSDRAHAPASCSPCLTRSRAAGAPLTDPPSAASAARGRPTRQPLPSPDGGARRRQCQ